MKIVEKICKEWNSICRVFDIKENPLTYSHKDLLEFAEYYHKSQLNNDVALDIVSGSKQIIEALDELVQVKEYKEKHGKDEQYETAKKQAWKNAKYLLNAYYRQR